MVNKHIHCTEAQHFQLFFSYVSSKLYLNSLFSDAMLLSTNVSKWSQTLFGSFTKGAAQWIISYWQEKELRSKGGQKNSYKVTVKSGSIFIFWYGSTAGNSLLFPYSRREVTAFCGKEHKTVAKSRTGAQSSWPTAYRGM